MRCAVLCCAAGYLPSFWIKLRNLDVPGPVLQLPGVSTEVRSSAETPVAVRRLCVRFLCSILEQQVARAAAQRCW